MNESWLKREETDQRIPSSNLTTKLWKKNIFVNCNSQSET